MAVMVKVVWDTERNEKRAICSECELEVLNWPQYAYWQCDHGPYGPVRRPLTDRELLEAIHSRLVMISRFLGLPG